MPSSSPSPQGPSSRFLYLGVGLAILLMLAALALFYVSLDHADKTSADATTIIVTASGCEPNSLTVPEGRTTFAIVNRSPRAIEWEILDGVMVLEERENIAPELRQPLTASLAPGDYQMTCGLLSNPRGTLHVTAIGDGSSRVVEQLPKKAFIGPLAEYSVYLTLQTRELTAAAQALRDAIATGDLAAAQAYYHEARLADQRLAMAIGLFSDLDQRLNARAEYFAEREDDPDFTGFHRLALGLFNRQTTDGLKPVAEQMVNDIGTLGQRLKQQAIPPAQLANGTARVLQAWHDHQANGQILNARELADLRGLKQGADKIVSLLAPLLERQAPAALGELRSQLAALHGELTSNAGSSTLDEIDRQALLADTDSLAKALASVNQALTLNS